MENDFSYLVLITLTKLNIMSFYKEKSFLRGAAFGLLAPVIGMWMGLAVMPFLGTILMAPIVLLSEILGEPFGNMSGAMRLLSLLLSMVFWGFVFWGIGKLVK